LKGCSEAAISILERCAIYKSIFDSTTLLYSSVAVVKRRRWAKMKAPEKLKFRVKFQSDFFEENLESSYKVFEDEYSRRSRGL
jgi:hypothetical protein